MTRSSGDMTVSPSGPSQMWLRKGGGGADEGGKRERISRLSWVISERGSGKAARSCGRVMRRCSFRRSVWPQCLSASVREEPLRYLLRRFRAMQALLIFD